MESLWKVGTIVLFSCFALWPFCAYRYADKTVEASGKKGWKGNLVNGLTLVWLGIAFLGTNDIATKFEEPIRAGLYVGLKVFLISMIFLYHDAFEFRIQKLEKERLADIAYWKEREAEEQLSNISDKK